MDSDNAVDKVRVRRKQILSEVDTCSRFEALKSTISKWELQRVGSVPKRYLLSYMRAVLGVSTRKGAIKSYCQHCVGWSELPDAVRDCTAKLCPLYAFRPYQKKAVAGGGQ